MFWAADLETRPKRLGLREKTLRRRVTKVEPVANPVRIDHLQRRSTGDGSSDQAIHRLARRLLAALHWVSEDDSLLDWERLSETGQNIFHYIHTDELINKLSKGKDGLESSVSCKIYV